MKTARHNSKIPGLFFQTKRICTDRYLSIIHKQSGLPIVNFNNPVYSVKAAMKKADEVLGAVKWDISEAHFTDDHGLAVLALKKQIVLDEAHKYKVL